MCLSFNLLCMKTNTGCSEISKSIMNGCYDFKVAFSVKLINFKLVTRQNLPNIKYSQLFKKKKNYLA